MEYELKRAGELPASSPQLALEVKKSKERDPAEHPAFHPDFRATFTTTNYWPLSRPVSRKGYPISSAWWDVDSASRTRARTELKSPTLYDWSDNPVPPSYHTIRSSSVIPDALYYQDNVEHHPRSTRATSVPTGADHAKPSVPILSSYESKPYYGSYNYPRTSPEPFYNTPREYRKVLYDHFTPLYHTSHDYDDDDSDYGYSPYLSPYHTRYYSRYYSPTTDSYDYYYRNPYLNTTLLPSNYVPLSLRYPYSFAASRYCYV